MTELKYKQIQNFLKEQIQKGHYEINDYLPSENELCQRFSITRTTVRKALDELQKEGFIERKRGKGSYVVERRKSLGLLTVKGFSEAVGNNVQTIFLQKPVQSSWGNEINLPVNQQDKKNNCLFFERLRLVGNDPVMLEKNWFSGAALPGFLDKKFTDSSFFKTLSRQYYIEITGSKQELRAEFASSTIAGLLNVKEDAPLLHISIKFRSTNKKLTIYSELYCNTKKFPISNSYYL